MSWCDCFLTSSCHQQENRFSEVYWSLWVTVSRVHERMSILKFRHYYCGQISRIVWWCHSKLPNTDLYSFFFFFFGLILTFTERGILTLHLGLWISLILKFCQVLMTNHSPTVTKHWSGRPERRGTLASVDLKDGRQRTWSWVIFRDFEAWDDARWSPRTRWAQWLSLMNPLESNTQSSWQMSSQLGIGLLAKYGLHGKMKLSVRASPSHGPLRLPECGERGFRNVLGVVGNKAEIGNFSVDIDFDISSERPWISNL